MATYLNSELISFTSNKMYHLHFLTFFQGFLAFDGFLLLTFEIISDQSTSLT
jgi:hypothetical protein